VRTEATENAVPFALSFTLTFVGETAVSRETSYTRWAAVTMVWLSRSTPDPVSTPSPALTEVIRTVPVASGSVSA
jgi:hypothetical protein